MTQSTAFRFSSLGIKIGNEPYRKTKITPRALIDHCTFDNFGGTDPAMDYKGIIEVKDYYFPWTISNSIFSNFQDTTKTALNFKTPQACAVVTVMHTCQWRCGVPPYTTEPLWPGYEFHDTIGGDPRYADAVNGDFTLPIDSPLLTFGSDGEPIGDLRWAKKSTSAGRNVTEPERISLSQNYPNPFNPSTEITFHLQTSGNVILKIFDMLGREIAVLAEGHRPAGSYRARWDARGCPSGIYYCRLITRESSTTRKMELLR
jgi:hypothetical protein